MPTIEQIRAARALLGWNQHDLADRAGLSQTGIARIENGTNQPNSKTLAKINGAFDKADIEFIDNGVRKRPEGRVTVFKNHEGFVQFLEMVYDTLKTEPEPEVVVNNVNEAAFLKWAGDYAPTHIGRLSSLNVSYKIIIEEGDQNFVADQYADYRWLDSKNFSNICYYVFANHVALINFEDHDVYIYIIESHAIASFYRNDFNKIWTISKPTTN